MTNLLYQIDFLVPLFHYFITKKLRNERCVLSISKPPINIKHDERKEENKE